MATTGWEVALIPWFMKGTSSVALLGREGRSGQRREVGGVSRQRDLQPNSFPPPNAALPTKLWETSTSKTLSQTALTIQSPSSNS